MIRVLGCRTITDAQVEKVVVRTLEEVLPPHPAANSTGHP